LQVIALAEVTQTETRADGSSPLDALCEVEARADDNLVAKHRGLCRVLDYAEWL
jgi:hypothetical protein